MSYAYRGLTLWNVLRLSGIYLAKLDSISLYSSADSSNLYSIASQCAGEGGNAVHQSRNLLMFLENRVINFTENCPEIVNERRTDITKTNSANPNIRLYPNPNNGYMVLEYNLKGEETGILNIYDITGKQMNTNILRNGSSKVVIEATILQPGVFMYEVLINNKKVKTDKLVIIK